MVRGHLLEQNAKGFVMSETVILSNSVEGKELVACVRLPIPADKVLALSDTLQELYGKPLFSVNQRTAGCRF